MAEASKPKSDTGDASGSGANKEASRKKPGRITSFLNMTLLTATMATAMIPSAAEAKPISFKQEAGLTRVLNVQHSRVGEFAGAQSAVKRQAAAVTRSTSFKAPEMNRDGRGFAVERPERPIYISRGWNRDVSDFFIGVNLDVVVGNAVATDIVNLQINAERAGGVVYCVARPAGLEAVVVQNGVAVGVFCYAPQSDGSVLIVKSGVESGRRVTSEFSISVVGGVFRTVALGVQW